MFNSTILDVALGMIFVYLLLSLMCSAAGEIIELMLKKRAIDLERGIRELLVPGSKSGAKDIVQKLYDHALINSLFGNTYGESRIDSKLRVVMRTQLPSYIPARSFALALMDLVGTPTAATPASPADTLDAQAPSGASCSTEGPPPVNPSQVVINLLNAKGEEASSISVPVTPVPSEGRTVPAQSNALASFRGSVLDNHLLPTTTRRALVTLLDASGNDMVKARENIENWYNASMDRVSSWYKRRVQIIIFVLGLALAIAVNADSLAIVKKLASEKALRDSLVAASQEYAKTSSASYEKNLQQINGLGLPLGWDSPDDVKRNWPGWSWKGDRGGWWDQVRWHWLGWFLTALAISLGAPFWFDLLNKFIVIRSAVKPHEKSPEEESKD